MLKYKKIKIGKKIVEGICLHLASKNLIVIRAKRGYIMCGYLNMKVARMFKDVAIKVKGVSNISDVLKAKVSDLTLEAKKLGIYKNQPIKDVLKLIA